MPIQLQNHKHSNAQLFQTGASHGSRPKLHTAASFRKSRGGGVTVLKNPDGSSGNGILQHLKKMPLRTNSNDRDGRSPPRKPRQHRRRHSLGGVVEGNQAQNQNQSQAQLPQNPPLEEPEGRDSFLTGMTIEVEITPEPEPEPAPTQEKKKKDRLKDKLLAKDNDKEKDKDTMGGSCPENLPNHRRSSKEHSNANANANLVNVGGNRRPGMRKAASFSIRGLRRRSSNGTTSTADSTLSGSHNHYGHGHGPSIASAGSLLSPASAAPVQRMSTGSSNTPSRRSHNHHSQQTRHPIFAQLPEQSEAIFQLDFGSSDGH